MTHKKIAFGIAVATTAAAVLGTVLLFGAAKHFAPVDQARANHSVNRPEIAELPNPALSRVRLLVSNLN
jgi:hypothetical protein